jgi:hypothetical protein
MDGGRSWQVQNSGVEDDLIAVTAVDGETAWAVGMNGTIVKTGDGGASWTTQASGGPTLRGVAAFGRETVYAVGAGGTILGTGVAAAQAAVTPTAVATNTAPTAPPTLAQPAQWNGTVTIVQKFDWQGAASAGRETYAGDGTAEMTTRIIFKDSVPSADTTFSGSTHYTTNGTGSPCNYEIKRTENGSASRSGPLEVSLGQPAGDRLSLSISVLPDPQGTVSTEEVWRNYGGEGCFTEVDRRQYLFGGNNSSLEGFFRELQFELEHGTLTTSLGVTPGGVPVYTATETTSNNVPMARPVSMPNIMEPGREIMTVTWNLQGTPGN